MLKRKIFLFICKITLLTVRARYITRQYSILPTIQCLLVTHTTNNTGLYYNSIHTTLNITLTRLLTNCRLHATKSRRAVKRTNHNTYIKKNK